MKKKSHLKQKTKKKMRQKKDKNLLRPLKKPNFYEGMDDTNKKAVDVMAEEGMETAVKHMFTDEKSGRTNFHMRKCVHGMVS